MEAIRSAATTMTFAMPGSAAFPDPQTFSFMTTVFFFSSLEAASKWIAESPGTVIISLDEGFALGEP